MDLMKTSVHHAQNVLSHHKNFTQFQKVIISSLFVGVLLCIFRNVWFIAISMTFTFTLYGSVTATKFLTARTELFASDILLIFIERWSIFVASVKESIFVPSGLEVEGKQDDTGDRRKKEDHELKENEEDHFYDSHEMLENRSIKDANKELKFVERTFSSKEKDLPDNVSPEVDRIIKLIKRDFIVSWYQLISEETTVLHEAELLLQHVVHGLSGRVTKLDHFRIINTIILMFREHLHNIKEAQRIFKAQRKRRKSTTAASPEGVHAQLKPPVVNYRSVEDCYGSNVDFHPAVKSAESEQCFLKSVIEILLIHLLREDLQESRSIFVALKELLMFNVLQNVMNLLSDSTFLHERIIKILSDEELEVKVEYIPSVVVSRASLVAGECPHNLLDEKHSSPEPGNASENTNTISSDLLKSSSSTRAAMCLKCTETNKTIQASPDLDSKPSDQTDGDDNKADFVLWNEDTEVHTVTKGICIECNRLCSVDKDRISPRPHSCSLGTTPLFYDPNTSKDPDSLSLNSLNSYSSVTSHDSDDFRTPLKHGTMLGDSTDFQSICEEPDPMMSVSGLDKKEIEWKSMSESDNSGQVNRKNSDNESVFVGTNQSDKRESLSQGSSPKKPSSPIFQFPNFSLPYPTIPFPFQRKRSSTPEEKERSIPTPSPTSESASFEKRNSSEGLKRSRSSGEVTPLLFEGVPCPTEVPPLFQDVRISGTETAKEAGGMATSYTLYILEFETLYQSEERQVHKTMKVKRRYREFVNLQLRLEDNPDYKKIMKDIKGPKKFLPSLPFGNMAKETVESRKEVLEQFLAALLKRPDICNGEEMKQFLGYSGDGHLAFVRKIPENIGPRIDQRLVKTMSGVFDKIVDTISLPQSAKNPPRIIKPGEQRGAAGGGESGEVSPVFRDDGDSIGLVYMLDDTKSGVLEPVYDKFIDLTAFELISEDDGNNTTLGTSVLSWEASQQLTSTSSPGSKLSTSPVHRGSTSSTSAQKTQPSTAAQPPSISGAGHLNVLDSSSTPFGDVVLDILAELLVGRGHWVSREAVVHTTRILLGKGLNRFVEGKVAGLLTQDMCVMYLKTLHETVWPDGKLSDDARPQYTDLQKENIKLQATRCLAEFFPGILQSILGEEDFHHAVNEMIDAFKYEKLNRHFWYTVLDVLLEELFPEVNTQELQRKLSSTPEPGHLI